MSYKNIRNPMTAAQLWDWSPLNECFAPTKIRVSDIDGHVERNGRFLYIETKGPDVPLTQGQEISFRNRVADGLSTYVVVWGNLNRPQEILIIRQSKDTRHKPANMQTLREVVSEWFRWANTQAAPPSKIGPGKDVHHMLPRAYPNILRVTDPVAWWAKYDAEHGTHHATYNITRKYIRPTNGGTDSQ